MTISISHHAIARTLYADSALRAISHPEADKRRPALLTPDNYSVLQMVIADCAALLAARLAAYLTDFSSEVDMSTYEIADGTTAVEARAVRLIIESILEKLVLAGVCSNLDAPRAEIARQTVETMISELKLLLRRGSTGRLRTPPYGL